MSNNYNYFTATCLAWAYVETMYSLVVPCLVIELSGQQDEFSFLLSCTYWFEEALCMYWLLRHIKESNHNFQVQK